MSFQGLVFGEFDIDKGSVVRCAIGVSLNDNEELYVAEQLLPDGCEKFSCSRSTFLLRRPSQGVRIDIEGSLFVFVGGEWEKVSSDSEIIRIEKGGMLSLLSSKSVRRWKCGADRLISQCESTSVGFVTLKLQVCWDTQLVEVKFDAPSELATPIISAWESNDTPQSETQMLYGVTCTLTKKDLEGKRGGLNKGVAILGVDAALLFSLWPLVYLICDQYCDMKEASLDTLASMFGWLQKSVGDVDFGDSRALTQRVCQAAKCSHMTPLHLFETPVRAECLKSILPRVWRSGLAWEHHPLPNFGVTELCLVFRERVAIIVTGILCGRRIVVKSHKLSATEVSEAALAIGIIGSLINPKFIEDHVFPYTSLSFQEAFLDSGRAFVVGTMNPMYDSQQQWWDLLCDLDSGDIRVGVSTTALVEESTPYFDDDRRTMGNIIQFIRQRSDFLGCQRVDIEITVRDMLKEYMTTILCSAMVVDDSTTGLIEEFRVRNMGRLLLSQFCSVTESFENSKFGDFGEKAHAVAIVTAIATLRRHGCTSSNFEVLRSLQTLLRHIENDENQPLFLELLPLTLGGLAPVAVHVMCPDPAVRLVAVAVLRKIERFPSGKLMLRTLSSFLLLTYEHAKNDLWDTISA